MDASGGGSGGALMVGTEVDARYHNGSWYPALVSALIGDKYVVAVRIQGSRPGIMLTCIVRFMAITPIVSEREGLQ